MSIEIKGIDQLLKRMDELDINLKKSTIKAVNQALNETLPLLKDNSPKDTSKSRDSLSMKGKGAKKYRKSTWGKLGITSENWNSTKSLWFQNYGFVNHITGEKVEKHIGFFDRASDKVLPKAEKIILKELNNEIKRNL